MARYQVVSTREVLGHEAGDIVELEDDVQGARLVAGGHLVRLAGGELRVVEADKPRRRRGAKSSSESSQDTDSTD